MFEAIMTITIPKAVGRLLITYLVIAFSASNTRAADNYSIQDADPTSFNFARGDSVEIRVIAPTATLGQRVIVKLNGRDISTTLHADETGAFTVTVSGLNDGENLLQLFPDKKAKKSVAELKVTRGIT